MYTTKESEPTVLHSAYENLVPHATYFETENKDFILRSGDTKHAPHAVVWGMFKQCLIEKFICFAIAYRYIKIPLIGITWTIWCSLFVIAFFKGMQTVSLLPF